MFSQQSILQLEQGLTKLGIQFNSSQLEVLFKFWSIVEEVNKTMNLTRITGDRAITHHFLDSAAVITQIENHLGKDRNLNIVDIGCGCGVPGMILQILRPTWKILLLDSLQKRIRFLSEAINSLGLSNHTKAVHGRAEELGRKNPYTGRYDVAVSRALSSLDQVVNYSLPFVKQGGIFVAMKGPKVKDEISDVQVKTTNLDLDLWLEQIDVPFLEEERYLAIGKKITV